MDYVTCPDCRSWPCICKKVKAEFYDAPNFGLADSAVLKILQCLERIEKLIEEANRKTALKNIVGGGDQDAMWKEDEG